jgi:peroxiredoxin
MASATPASYLDVDWSKLPVPIDDGAMAHVPGTRLPSVPLPATNGQMVDLAGLAGRVVVFAYPKTGRPGIEMPDGWDDIPGARGCTPQSCAFRDLHDELTRLGAAHVFGLSTQDTAYQTEAATRLHLPFPLLSDADLKLTTALKLPTHVVEGQTLLARFAWIADNGVVSTVFYPVFPPDRNAGDVAAWLAANPTQA